MRKYLIGCDDAAVELKDAFIGVLKEAGIEVCDMGVKNKDDKTYYPNVAKALCEKIIADGYKDRGILICGTGIGMSISANKFKGIRAAICNDAYSGERSVLSNDANVFCFGQRVVGVELAKKILREIISLEYKDGPSTPKINAIKDLEK